MAASFSETADGGPSRLQADLAAKIVRMLHAQRAGPGHHLVELDLCQTFGVSRTPIRGALKLLAQQGTVEARANRGFVLVQPVDAPPSEDLTTAQDDEDERLFVAIARARNDGTLPEATTQQEMLRMFASKRANLVRVLQQLADIGLVERKPGNGWLFTSSIDSARAQEDSYAYRRIIEPAGILEATFELDRKWMERSREQHLQFAKRRWRDTLAVEFYRMNSDFHEQLARCSGNRYLLGAVQRQNQLRSFLNYHWTHGPERVTESIEEHLAIMDALDRGRAERAHVLMKEHLSSSAQAYSPADASSSQPGSLTR